tara:strand:+ start:138 stop:839 length:702 start_codon:yes stop_codon:yes gene_type:complete
MPVKSKKQKKFMQAVANNPEFAKKVGVKQSIGREFTKEKSMKTKKMNMGGRTGDMMYSRGYGVGNKDKRMPTELMTAPGMKKGGKVKKMRKGGNTSRMNELEELGRVDAEKGYTAKGKRNLKDEKARVVREIKNKKAGGKVKGYKAGGMMADKEGRALVKKTADARGRAMKKGGGVMTSKARTGGSSAPMKAKGKKMMMGGKVKGYKKGGTVSSASKRADGIAQQGHTRGRMV